MDKRKAIGAIAAAPAERKGRDLEVGEVREGVGMIELLTLPSRLFWDPDLKHILQQPGSRVGIRCCTCSSRVQRGAALHRMFYFYLAAAIYSGYCDKRTVCIPI